MDNKYRFELSYMETSTTLVWHLSQKIGEENNNGDFWDEYDNYKLVGYAETDLETKHCVSEFYADYSHMGYLWLTLPFYKEALIESIQSAKEECGLDVDPNDIEIPELEKARKDWNYLWKNLLPPDKKLCNFIRKDYAKSDPYVFLKSFIAAYNDKDSLSEDDFSVDLDSDNVKEIVSYIKSLKPGCTVEVAINTETNHLIHGEPNTAAFDKDDWDVMLIGEYSSSDNAEDIAREIGLDADSAMQEWWKESMKTYY